MPSTRRARRKSRKTGAGSRSGRTAVATIPELKHSFDTLEHKVQAILHQKVSPNQQVKMFQDAWRSIFHRPVSAASAEAYLQLKRSSKGRSGAAGAAGTRRAHGKQRGGGGAQMNPGAPLDSTTGPGLYGNYGSFPTYQAAGLGFYDMINKDGLAATCGQNPFTADGTQAGAGPGPGQGGGGVVGAISDTVTSFLNRPMGASAGDGVGVSAMKYAMGMPLGASPVMDQNPGLLKF